MIKIGIVTITYSTLLLLSSHYSFLTYGLTATRRRTTPVVVSSTSCTSTRSSTTPHISHTSISHTSSTTHLQASSITVSSKAEQYEDSSSINHPFPFYKQPSPTTTTTIQQTTTTTTTNNNMLEQVTTTTTATTAPPQTDTVIATPDISEFNPPPKIVILGATGGIGRRVIQQLMAQKNRDMTIVAFVRDYEKACEVLYDELILDQSDMILGGSSSTSNTANINPRRRKKGPQLQLVVGDLVPQCEVFGYTSSQQRLQKQKQRKRLKNNQIVDEEDDDEEEDEAEYAVSASRFYSNNIEDYNYQTKELEQDDEYYTSPNLPLQTAIANATVIINTVGAVRTTVPFADYVWKPWRLFRQADKWCKDRNHPYYVNTMVMKKVLDYAEEEQQKRNVAHRLACAAATIEDHDTNHGEDATESEDMATPSLNRKQQSKSLPKLEKIRIIRISDLCVAHPAWDFVTLLTNCLRSVVFSTQERCEKLLAKSNLVDTIILRPGDLTDEVRNQTTTSIQTATSGYLPSPAYVGRDDVAALAVMASQYNLDAPTKQKSSASAIKSVKLQPSSTTTNGKTSTGNFFRRRKNLHLDSDSSTADDKAKHWVVGVRWAGKEIMQGCIHDGHANVNDCMKSIIKQQTRKAVVEKRKEIIQNSSTIGRIMTVPIQKKLQALRNQRLKPYATFVLLPMLLFVYPMLVSILWSIGKRIPIVETCIVRFVATLQPVWMYLIRMCREVAWQQVLLDFIGKARRAPFVR